MATREITLADVEEAVEDMRVRAAGAAEIYKQARLAEHLLKSEIAIRSKMSNQSSDGKRNAEALSTEQVKDAQTEDATAFANRHMHEHYWELNRTIISVWQSKVKDRI
jgi:ribosomal protein L16/L10AE